MANTTKPQSYSERHSTYLDYTEQISSKQATAILTLILVCMVVGEAALRVITPDYPRTAICSLHGIRTIFQEAVADRSPKIILLGDSTLVGGGVYDDNLTVAGRMRNAIGDNPKIYNLAVPGGDNATSLVLLDALNRAGITNVDRVVVETIPNKFETVRPYTITEPNASIDSMNELAHFIPYVQPAAWSLDYKPQSMTDQTETDLEYWLGTVSKLYQNRDYFRTRYIGNYPAMWVLGEVTPKSIKVKIFGAGGEGTNRLGARNDDAPFRNSMAKPIHADLWYVPEPQSTYLKQCLDLAATMSKKPPIAVLFPTHYLFNKLTPKQEHAEVTQLAGLYEFFSYVAKQNGGVPIVIQSEQMQNPDLWLRTVAHFNADGSAIVWSKMKKKIVGLYPQP